MYIRVNDALGFTFEQLNHSKYEVVPPPPPDPPTRTGERAVVTPQEDPVAGTPTMTLSFSCGDIQITGEDAARLHTWLSHASAQITVLR